jgi:chromatin structure-remodeling complex subunit RSC9
METPESPTEVLSPAYLQEREQFLAQLRAFHEKRGTTCFDPNPKVGSKHIDLLRLYKVVVERGGYDKVSDIKLHWRKIASEFGLPVPHLAALSFGLKSVYYRQLAAYEIVHVHGKEPPPKEILEETTAKGASLLTRTVENFRPSARREAGALGNENSEASGDDGTPARDRIGSEETPGSGSRVTRGLRQAPPQRVLFQPDTQPLRTLPKHIISTRATAVPPLRTTLHPTQTTRLPARATLTIVLRCLLPCGLSLRLETTHLSLHAVRMLSRWLLQLKVEDSQQLLHLD